MDMADFIGLPGCSHQVVYAIDPFQSTTTLNAVECAMICARTFGCFSVNACKRDDGAVTCDILGDVSSSGCSGMTSKNGCRHLQRKDALRALNPCKNGGTWTGTICICIPGYAGQYCGRYIYSCKEGTELGVTGTGFYKVQPATSPVAFTVYCNCNAGTVWVFRRYNPVPSWCPGISYNRTWEEYKHGFGDVNCEYFLGLETIYQLNFYNQYQWNIYNVVEGTPSVASVYMESTTLTTEATDYQINLLSVFSRDHEWGDDAFDDSDKPRRFCTWDKDCWGCAKTVGGGWWFKSDCTGGALTAPLDQLKWPVRGVDKVIGQAFLQLDQMDLAP
ncbi:ficolin-1-A-like [Haliotis rubra]|uniref:ficolin-1-A-like n=1 Tax=Haliotis rubra TaxID=36100 RepID=UPI001EE5CB24|nr:ficolin-1-A-like [Haliotis rubra]